METVTLRGPVVVLPAETYHELLTRVERLETMIQRLAQFAEDMEDIQAMRETEVEYRTEGGVAFEDLLTEVAAETG